MEDEIDWENVDVVLPQKKRAISIRLDADILEFFRQKGSGYQPLINAILRAYVDTAKNKK